MWQYERLLHHFSYGPWGTPNSHRRALLLSSLVMFPIYDFAKAIVSCRPSGVAASNQAANPTGRGRHRVEHRAGTRVLPDVHYLRPLELRIYARLLQGDRFVYAEVGGQRCQNVGPDPLLLCRADYPEAHLVDRVVGARQRLNLGHRCAVVVLKCAEGVPTGLRVPFWRHDGKRLLVSVDHAYARVHRHTPHRGADEQHLPGRDARHRRVDPTVGRLELGEALLPDPHDLFRRRLDPGQTHLVGLLPELPESLQRANLATPLHVHIGGPLGHVGDLQPLYPLRPEGGVAGLGLLFFLLSCFVLRSLLRHRVPPSVGVRPLMPSSPPSRLLLPSRGWRWRRR